MRKRVNKLSLRKETIRDLTDLGVVRGGENQDVSLNPPNPCGEPSLIPTDYCSVSCWKC
jgi:hypothetical protein